MNENTTPEHSPETKKPTPPYRKARPNWRQNFIEDGKRWSRENNAPIPEHQKLPRDRKKPGPEVVRGTWLRETNESPKAEKNFDALPDFKVAGASSKALGVPLS